jgi:kynurenine formamidase
MLKKTLVALAVTAVAAGSFMSGMATGARRGGGDATRLPGFDRIVSLSHVNAPRRTPLFPGDPPFSLETVTTVAADGYYMQYIRENEHTGTHYSAPCHFHADGLCADELAPADFVLPAVVVDVRAEVAADPVYEATVADLKAWESAHGQMPEGAAVLLWTGCGRHWGPLVRKDRPTYYNCGHPGERFTQPGFSKWAVKWLIATGVLGRRGALGTDTFGPDPSTDATFTETWLALRRHRFTIENLANLARMPTRGGWIVIGGPRNGRGSGAPSTVFGLVP